MAGAVSVFDETPYRNISPSSITPYETISGSLLVPVEPRSTDGQAGIGNINSALAGEWRYLGTGNLDSEVVLASQLFDVNSNFIVENFDAAGFFIRIG